MANPTIAQFLRMLEALIASHAEGIGTSDIQAELVQRSLSIPRRTLQRRIEALIEEGKVVAEGGSRSTRYRSKPIVTPSREPARDEIRTTDSYIPLSSSGLQVRDQVRRPITQRKPVGYQRAFLDRYRPNSDFNLTTNYRKRLHEMGRTEGKVRAAGTHARSVIGRLLIDLSWASSRLEGNTYTRLETQRLIEFGLSAEGKDAQETQMILNHKSAIELVVDQSDDIGFDRFSLLNLHAVLSDNLMPDPRTSGRLRAREVEISGTVFMPLASSHLISNCFEAMLAKAAQINDPFEQAFFGMVHIPYLQPFEDVNKRVSRLAANIPLIRSNLCPLSFVDVPEKAYVEGTLGVYELNRVELLRDVFVWAYQRSCQRYLAIKQSIGEPDAFRMKYRDAIRQVVQSIVARNLQGTPVEIFKNATGLINTNDEEAFVQLVAVDLDNLYRGNTWLHRVALSDYQAWSFKRNPEN